MARSGKMKPKAHFKRRGQMAGSRANPSLNHLSMQEAARNTERHRTSWSGTQLRHRAVNFVSAGDIESDETIDREPPGASEEPEDSELCPDLTADRETASDGLELPIDKPSESTAYTQQPKPDPQHCLPTPGDSSEDEIVFHGRGKPGKPQRHWRQMGSGLMPAPCDDSKDVEDRREELDCKHRDGQFISTIAATTLPTSDDAVPSLHSPPGRTVITDHSEDVDYISLNPVPPKQKTRRAHTEDENDAMEDYIANVDIDYEDMVNSFNPRGGPPVLYTLSPSSKSSNSAENDELGVSFGINSSLSTRGSALSVQDYYMENNQGLSGGEAGRRKSLKQEERLAVSQNKSHRDPTKVPDRDIVLGRDSCFQPGSDEEFPPDSEVEQDDLDVLQSKLASPQQWAFQLASMGALETDPDYGLDVLELSKAGRKKSKKKQKQVGLDLNISDSELEFELEKAWAKDRGKKKVKKQKREELRSQGLLGRGVGKPDLKTKYSNGMDLEDFKQETKRFLLSPKNSLPLPPMKKQQRKLVHDLAGVLSLKSQSRGHGPSRFPVLYKTGRTPNYTPKMISQIDSVFSKGKFKGLAKGWNQNTAGKSSHNRRGHKDTSVSYMDGDVVGATAPEIGAENKGRAMLEKMGWSMGTALGATNNKGILMPVAHVVKNSRAGLG